MNTLILSDNQAITRMGMKTIAITRFDKVLEADDIHVLTKKLLTEERAVAVIDYTLFDCTAEQLLVVKERFPASLFILFSDALSEEFIRRMVFSNPKFSILMKDSSLDEIESCLEKAKNGIPFICAKASALLEKETKTQEDDSPLTATEKEILKAMAMGKTTKEIASERFLSVYTVMTHRKNIFRKLQVNNVHEAVRYALRAGIVDAMEYYI